MADQSDVENAMVSIVSGILYPAGATGMAPSPVAGALVQISRGWPFPTKLDAALKAGAAMVTVDPAAARTTTRYQLDWQQGAAVTVTMTVAVDAMTVTFGGTAAVGQVAGVAIGTGTLFKSYAYWVLAGDDIDAVAAAFAAMIPGAEAAGPVLTLNETYTVAARVVADTPALMEVRRQDQMFWVRCFCPTPALRDTIASAVDAGIAGLMNEAGAFTRFIPLADGTAGWIRYGGTQTIDDAQNAKLFRRDIGFFVEYPTTLVQQQPGLLFPGTVLKPGLQPDAGFTFIGNLQPSNGQIVTDTGDEIVTDTGAGVVVDSGFITS